MPDDELDSIAEEIRNDPTLTKYVEAKRDEILAKRRAEQVRQRASKELNEKVAALDAALAKRTTTSAELDRLYREARETERLARE